MYTSILLTRISTELAVGFSSLIIGPLIVIAVVGCVRKSSSSRSENLPAQRPVASVKPSAESVKFPLKNRSVFGNNSLVGGCASSSIVQSECSSEIKIPPNRRRRNSYVAVPNSELSIKTTNPPKSKNKGSLEADSKPSTRPKPKLKTTDAQGYECFGDFVSERKTRTEKIQPPVSVKTTSTTAATFQDSLLCATQSLHGPSLIGKR